MTALVHLDHWARVEFSFLHHEGSPLPSFLVFGRQLLCAPHIEEEVGDVVLHLLGTYLFI
jgi:hypothetical protein